MRPNLAFTFGLVAVLLGASGLARAQSDPAADWLAGASFRGAPPVTDGGPAIDFKFANGVPPASLLNPVWQKTIDRLAKQSGGKLQGKMFGAGTLLSVRDGFKGVRGGVADWATCYVQNEGRALPLSRILEQPFVAPSNPMAGVRIMQELAPKYFVPEFQKQGVHWGAAISALPTDLMSKKPVRRWEDLAGMKIIAQGFPPELAKAMGATFVNVPFPEAYTALQQGLADAMFWVDAGFVPYKIFEVAKFHTTVGLTGLAINHCYGRDFAAKLPPDLREMFADAQEAMAMAGTKVTMVDFNKTALATYKERGVELITLPPAELQRWRERSAVVLDQWVADLEKEGQPARALLADFRRLAERYNGMTPEQLMRLSIDNPVRTGLR
mgnify:CR=1 FL=1